MREKYIHLYIYIYEIDVRYLTSGAHTSLRMGISVPYLSTAFIHINRIFIRISQLEVRELIIIDLIILHTHIVALENPIKLIAQPRRNYLII